MTFLNAYETSYIQAEERKTQNNKIQVIHGTVFSDEEHPLPQDVSVFSDSSVCNASMLLSASDNYVW